jgi:hypothetical protein
MSHAAALHWIIDLLNERHIPFLLCGGLAAHVYGARRSLNDIDLLVPADRLQEIAAAGAAVTTKPLERRCEEGWDVEYVQFKVEGVKIEIGGTPGARIFDKGHSTWRDLEANLAKAHRATLLGVALQVMDRDELAAYKAMLGREVDTEDLIALSTPHP